MIHVTLDFKGCPTTTVPLQSSRVLLDTPILAGIAEFTSILCLF